MITENVKISLDSDTAAQVALDTNFTYDVGFNLPMPKLSKLELLGINGDVDITNALSTQTFYGNRTVNISLVVKNGSVNGGLVCDNFVNTYDGQRVRLHINNLYFLRGRLTVIGDNRADALRQLSVTIDAEPLRYYSTYLPNSTGTDLRPTAWSANMWNSTNISGTGVTVSGATIPADHIADQNYHFYLLPAYFTAGKLVRIYLQNISNCIIEIRQGDSVKSRGAGSHIVLAQSDPYAQTNLYVIPIDHAQSASFECIVRTIDTTTITTDSKAVPLQIESTYVPNVNYPVKMFLNGTIFTVKPDDYSGTWREYAPAMLKTGDNKIATFVDVSTFDPSAAGSSGVLNVRYRGGVL